MKKILVAEDEENIRDFVVINLKRSGYDVVDVSNGEDAVSAFMAAPDEFSVVLLDVMMPGLDGFQVCKKIREKSESVGIIMLTARAQEMDKVNGLMIGADDYVTKPFSPSELVARVDAICRRVTMAREKAAGEVQEISNGPFILNFKSRTLTKSGVQIPLTQVEYQLMELFLKNPDTALARADILTAVWGPNYYAGDEKIVDVNVRRLRIKIEYNSSEPHYLTTVWGYGYKWNSQ